MTRAASALALVSAGAAPTDVMDVAIALLAAARGRPAGQVAALIGAAKILIDASQALPTAPEPVPLAPRRRQSKRRGRGPDKAPRKPKTRRAARRAPPPLATATIDAPASPSPVLHGGGSGRGPAAVSAPAASAPPRPAPAPKPPASSEPPLVRDGITVDFAACAVRVDGASVDLSAQQMRLVAALLRGSPNPIDRNFLSNKVWGGGNVPATAEACLYQLATACAGKLAPLGLVIKTIRGVGIALQKAPA